MIASSESGGTAPGNLLVFLLPAIGLFKRGQRISNQQEQHGHHAYENHV
jgi:hypothetical protein